MLHARHRPVALPVVVHRYPAHPLRHRPPPLAHPIPRQPEPAPDPIRGHAEHMKPLRAPAEPQTRLVQMVHPRPACRKRLDIGRGFPERAPQTRPRRRPGHQDRIPTRQRQPPDSVVRRPVRRDDRLRPAGPAPQDRRGDLPDRRDRRSPERAGVAMGACLVQGLRGQGPCDLRCGWRAAALCVGHGGEGQ